MNDKLNIISTEKSTNPKNPLPNKNDRRLETQAKFDRLWLTDPAQFNPLRNCMERERLERTVVFIRQSIDPAGKRGVDLGCGAGVFTRKLRDAGAIMQAVDVSSKALKALKEEDMHHIEPIQGCLPDTSLQDRTYDLVLATEVIAYLSPSDYRVFFAELARLVKDDGYVICSTSLDINTEGALEKFGYLAETELHNLKWAFSYHLFYIKIKEFFEAPAQFARGSIDREYRKRALEERRKGWWFRVNSTKVLGTFWRAVQFLTNPVSGYLRNSRWALLNLEKFCRFLWSDSGISHVIILGQRRPLVKPTEAELHSQEIKHKKQVWE